MITSYSALQFLPIIESYKESHSTGTTTPSNGQFAQKPNILDVKVWQTSWASGCVPLKSIPTWLSQSRKYCTCGFEAVLGNKYT